MTSSCWRGSRRGGSLMRAIMLPTSHVLRSMATRTPPGKKKAPAKKATKAKATKAAKAPKATKAAAAVVAERAPAVKRVKGSAPVRAFKGGGRTLVIVESPTKARTIRAFLPAGYRVEASMGHVRDLPGDAKEIPAKYKALEWSRLGVNVDNDFEPLYIVPVRQEGDRPGAEGRARGRPTS